MTYTRQNVWSLQKDWHPTLLWYAKGVQILQKRDFTDVTSWRYLAAIHGVDEDAWKYFGWMHKTDTLPQTSAFQNEDRDQCQHHGWYFLPWHRGYLASFEAIVRAAIKTLPGAPDDWALPYWNYNDPKVADPRQLPPAFTSQAWPGDGVNPLYVDRRYGRGDGVVVIRPQDVSLDKALGATVFAGTANGSPGIGGVETPFQHMADRASEGWLEQQPHDNVHSRVGGTIQGKDPNDWKNAGLMAMPETAALDPIFWLHHANIDRLWEVWRNRDADNTNPDEDAWKTGPKIGGAFILPQPDGSRAEFHPGQMVDTKAAGLDYVYEDIADPLGGDHRLQVRLNTISKMIDAPGILDRIAEKPMPARSETELLGANANAIELSNAATSTLVRLDKPTAVKVADSFKADEFVQRASPEPDRVFLNLENITGENDAAILDVYVGLPEGADPEKHPENFAGVVSLFGLRSATNMAKPHGGAGMNKVLEITDIVDRLHLVEGSDLTALPVLFIPTTDIGTGGISIKRVSIYRQGS